MTRQSLAFMIILTGVFLAACATGASIESASKAAMTSEETLLSMQSFAAGATIAALSAADDARIESYGLNWKLLPVSNSPETFRIIEVGGTPFKTYGDPTKTLDLLIMNSPDYEDPEDFYGDVQPMVGEVFGSPNVLDSGLEQRFPFNYYVTSFQYPADTPQNSLCLPRHPVPQSNTLEPSVNMPTWNCNIALSTIGANGVSLNLGLIIHRGDITDSSQFNLFSSEHNSYATILHELSHAAFAMSDEYKGPAGKFHPLDSPNVYLTKKKSSCDAACPNKCLPIEDTDLYRCKPADDTTNLMYFFPQPTPGANAGWSNYQYHFSSYGRLKYIYGECAKGEC